MPEPQVSLFQEYIVPILTVVGGLIATLVGWIFSRQIAKIDSVSIDLETHKLHVSNHHATHDDIDELKKGLYSRWDRLEDKVDKFLETVSMSVNRPEFEIAKDQLHARINDLEKRKQDKGD